MLISRTSLAIRESHRLADRFSVLLLADDDPSHAGTILDHIAAFGRYSRHKIDVVNPRGVNDFVTLHLDRYDVVVIHYSLCVLYESYLSGPLKQKLKQFSGRKIQFIQDDYRWVDAITAVMREIGIDELYTLVPEGEIQKIWTEDRLPGVQKFNTLAGYIPERLCGLSTPLTAARPLDIGYRGRVLPYWLGRIGQEKMWIGQGVQARAEQFGLHCDIAWNEQDRIYGEQWDAFLDSCKATLGTESGATITDFDGSIEAAVRKYVSAYPEADFEEVYQHVLHPNEGNVRMNIISPKIFEAISHRTALILFPGSYSGVLQPWKHYLPLEKDFSNLPEVVAKVKHIESLQDMVDRTYRDIVESGEYSFQMFVQQFDRSLERGVQIRSRNRTVKEVLWQSVPAEFAPRCERGLRIHALKLKIGVSRVTAMLRTAVSKFIDPSTARLIGLSVIVAQGVMTSSFLWRIALRYCIHHRQRSSVHLGKLVKELLLLRLLEKLSCRGPSTVQPFFIVAALQLNKGFVSFRSEPWSSMCGGFFVELGGSSDSTTLLPFHWRTIFRAILDGQIKQFVWDHSAVGSQVSFRVARIVPVSMEVGEGGVQSFPDLLKLPRRMTDRSITSPQVGYSQGLRQARRNRR